MKKYLLMFAALIILGYSPLKTEPPFVFPLVMPTYVEPKPPASSFLLKVANCYLTLSAGYMTRAFATNLVGVIKGETALGDTRIWGYLIPAFLFNMAYKGLQQTAGNISNTPYWASWLLGFLFIH